MNIAIHIVNLLLNVLSSVEEEDSTFVCRDRDMAYTFLFVALEAVRRAARHAFWNDKKRLRGYASEYFRKSSRKKKGN